MHYNYDAIILDKKDVGEVDRLYIFYTRERGLMATTAKGVRKPTAKLAAHLEPFTHTHLSVVRGRGAGTIRHATAEEAFPQAKASYDTMQELLFARAFFRLLVHDEQQDQRLFDLLLTYLRFMDDHVDLPQERRTLMTLGFIFSLFSLCGYHIHEENCARCGNTLDPQGSRFSMQHGGIVCAACARKDARSLPLSHNAIKVLRLINASSFLSLRKLVVSSPDLQQLQRIAHGFVQWNR